VYSLFLQTAKICSIKSIEIREELDYCVRDVCYVAVNWSVGVADVRACHPILRGRPLDERHKSAYHLDSLTFTGDSTHQLESDIYLWFSICACNHSHALTCAWTLADWSSLLHGLSSRLRA